VVTKLCKMTPSICVTNLAPGILRFLLDFFSKICVHLVSVIFLCWPLACNFPALRISLQLSLRMVWKIVLAVLAVQDIVMLTLSCYCFYRNWIQHNSKSDFCCILQLCLLGRISPSFCSVFGPRRMLQTDVGQGC
jgi:hypothetical protein